jgi:hypothetical protein
MNTPPPDSARRGREPQRLRAHLEKLQCLGPKEKLRYIVAGVKRIYRRIRHPLPLARPGLAPGHFQALREYTPEAYPGPATLFQSSQQPVRIKKAQLGWGRWALGGLEIDEVSGESDTLFTEPHVGVLAERLRDSLGKTEVNGGRSSAVGRESSPSSDTTRAWNMPQRRNSYR